MSYENSTRHDHEEYGEKIVSKVVRAGKRTYFIDVKATRSRDLFLTITESRRKMSDSGSASFTRHQIHLYKEDFEKFTEGLNEMVEYAKSHIDE